jgi:hypothetical protein
MEKTNLNLNKKVKKYEDEANINKKEILRLN